MDEFRHEQQRTRGQNALEQIRPVPEQMPGVELGDRLTVDVPVCLETNAGLARDINAAA